MVYRKKTSVKGYRKRTPIFKKMNTSKLVANKRRSNLVKLIKDINISESEMKYKSATIETGVMNHNQVLELHCWGPSGSYTFNTLPAQVISDSARVGDRIYLKGIMIRAQVQISWDRKGTRLAVYFVPHNSEQGSPTSNLFHDISGMTLLDPIQKKRYPKAKLLGIYKSEANDQHTGSYGGTIGEPTVGGQKYIYFKKFIPINKKVWFNADASVQPTNLEEYGTICLCPFDKTLSFSSDNVIMGGTVCATAYYKDI